MALAEIFLKKGSLWWGIVDTVRMFRGWGEGEAILGIICFLFFREGTAVR